MALDLGLRVPPSNQSFFNHKDTRLEHLGYEDFRFKKLIKPSDLIPLLSREGSGIITLGFEQSYK